jgi:hypothetical protein
MMNATIDDIPFKTFIEHVFNMDDRLNNLQNPREKVKY